MNFKITKKICKTSEFSRSKSHGVRYSTSALEPFSTFFDVGHNLLFNFCNYLIFLNLLF